MGNKTVQGERLADSDEGETSDSVYSDMFKGTVLLNPVAQELIHGRVTLKVMLGDILDQEVDAVAFPADLHLRFRKESYQRSYQSIAHDLQSKFNDPKVSTKPRALRYDQYNVRGCKVYFCKVPTWMGGTAERLEFEFIIRELFDLIMKDGVVTMALYLLNNKNGSFPLHIVARLMYYYINDWVKENAKNKNLKLSTLSIVCENYAAADAFCAEIEYFEENMILGNLNTRMMRRMSEDLEQGVDKFSIQFRAIEDYTKLEGEAKKQYERDLILFGDRSRSGSEGSKSGGQGSRIEGMASRGPSNMGSQAGSRNPTPPKVESKPRAEPQQAQMTPVPRPGGRMAAPPIDRAALRKQLMEQASDDSDSESSDDKKKLKKKKK